MNWKREAIDKLKLYKAKRQAVENIPEELHRLELSSVGIRSASRDKVAVAGSPGSGREDAMLSNLVHREELKAALKQARHWVRQVDAGLKQLTTEERLVLERFYISPAKGNVARLCEELGVEQATVYRRRDDALRHFTIALYGATET